MSFIRIIDHISLLIAVFFVSGINSSLKAQSLQKELLSKTWACNCNFNSETFVLSADNKTNSECEAKFSATGKVILHHIKKRRTDSIYTYNIDKNSLTLNCDLKDSVKTLEYVVKKVPEKEAYRLNLKFRSRYVKRRGDDTITMDKITLIKNGQKNTIEREEGITIFSQKKALHNDSIDRAVWGSFVGYVADTILVDSDQFVEHNFYKKYTDTLHYIAPLLLDTIVRIKVPVKEITGIYIQREPFTSYTTGATMLALGSGLLCISASLMTSDKPIGKSFAQIGVISFLTIPISFSLGLIFSKKKFQLVPSTKMKKNWVLERHMPNTVVIHRKPKKEDIRIR